MRRHWTLYRCRRTWSRRGGVVVVSFNRSGTTSIGGVLGIDAAQPALCTVLHVHLAYLHSHHVLRLRKYKYTVYFVLLVSSEHCTHRTCRTTTTGRLPFPLHVGTHPNLVLSFCHVFILSRLWIPRLPLPFRADDLHQL